MKEIELTPKAEEDLGVQLPTVWDYSGGCLYRAYSRGV